MPDALASDPGPEGKGVSAPELRLGVLGNPVATVAGRVLPLGTRKAKALVAYLCLSDNVAETRERLVGLLWSESDEERARASLRQAVHEVRSACHAVGFAGFQSDKQTLGLAHGSFDTDVNQILSALEKGEVHSKLLQTSRISEAFFEGFEDLDPALGIWVRAKRQVLQDRLTGALERLLLRDPAANDAAMALLNLDPTHEPACRSIILARTAQGDVGGAMRAYKALWDALEADFDVEPSEETQALVVGIRQRVAQSGAEAGQAVAPTPQIMPPSPLLISVFGFDAGGVPSDRHYLVHGFRHELVACLTRFREWSVRSLPQNHSPEPLSWSSPPEYQIEGTTYQAGAAIKLVITFRDAATSICVWSEVFVLDLASWPEAQQTIIQRIATALNVNLSAERLRRFAAGNPVHDLHDRWLRGQMLAHRLASSDWEIAARIFEDLVRDAPDYVPALTSLVQLHNTEHIAHPGRFRNPFRNADVLMKARRAAQLDPLDSRAQLNLAWTFQLHGRVHASTLHAGLAADLNANDPWTVMSSGQIFAYCGDLARAEALAKSSLEATPMVSPQQMTYLSAIKFLSGDYSACVEAADQGLEASPGFRVWACSAFSHLGEYSNARAQIEQAYEEIARDWHGKSSPEPAMMSRWMLHMFPIALEADWERLRSGLATAGAPVANLEFGEW